MNNLWKSSIRLSSQTLDGWTLENHRRNLLRWCKRGIRGAGPWHVECWQKCGEKERPLLCLHQTQRKCGGQARSEIPWLKCSECPGSQQLSCQLEDVLFNCWTNNPLLILSLLGFLRNALQSSYLYSSVLSSCSLALVSCSQIDPNNYHIGYGAIANADLHNVHHRPIYQFHLCRGNSVLRN